MNIKQEMTAYFQLPQVNGLILQYLSKHDLSYQSLTDQELMNILDQLEILDPLLKKIQQPSYQQPLDKFGITTYSKTLKVRLQRGRGFKEWRKNSPTDKFYISLCGFSQKFRTNSYPLSQKFSIGEQFNFQTSLQDLIPSSSQQLHLILVILNKQGKRQINSVKLIQWRYVLSQGAISFDVELASYHHEGLSQLPVIGVISLKIHLYPLSKLNVITQKAVERQLQLQKKNKQKQNNTFYNYANLYWNQYKAINKNFQSRRIKIYGDSQDKILVPLNRFVYPLYNVRGIDSPQHALRFTSLIPFQQSKLNKPTINKRFHSIIVGMQGSVQDHANLLCSLLLGFGLKSYVALGHCNKGEHAWVITQDTKNGSLLFWQSTKGAKYDYYSHKTYNFYKTIHVVYNHNQYYANIQLDDSISGTKYNFKDGTMWKKMDQSFLKPTPLHNRNIALSTPNYDVIKMQNDLQNAICQNIGQFRKINKLGFSRDKILSSILQTALINYEIERVTGITFCQDEFENAIKNYVPLKHTFKAFPIQLTTLDPAIIMQTLKNQPKCRQILLIKGDSVNFGIKCKLIVYPDNIFALWISIGVRYFKIG